jgi:hypothetical protein
MFAATADGDRRHFGLGQLAEGSHEASLARPHALSALVAARAQRYLPGTGEGRVHGAASGVEAL